MYLWYFIQKFEINKVSIFVQGYFFIFLNINDLWYNVLKVRVKLNKV